MNDINKIITINHIIKWSYDNFKITCLLQFILILYVYIWIYRYFYLIFEK